MKILLYRYGSICESDVIAGFTELGHTIYQIQHNSQKQAISPQAFLTQISEKIFEIAPDFIFSINFFPFLSEICNVFRLPYLCWTVDSPVMELYSASITNRCNRIFLFDYAQYNEFSPYNPENIHHLPLAVNTKQKQNIIKKASATVRKNFSSSVSFVGSLYTEKCPYDKLKNPPAYLDGYLNGLMEAQMHIYGGYIIDNLLSDEIVTEFKNHLPNFYQHSHNSFLTDKITMSQLYIGNKISAMERSKIMKLLSARFDVDLYTGSDTTNFPHIHNRGLANTIEEMPVIFNQSKINLNITSKAIRSGLPLRIFDILGCEGFCMTNYQAELTDLFIPNEDLVFYESFDDLLEKTEYYLTHESKRKEIAHNGFDKVEKYHSYPIRLQQMLNLAGL